MKVSASEPTETRFAERERCAPITLGSAVTVALLVLVLFSAPLVLGAARLWYELPLLEIIALLMLLQAGRLALGAVGSLRVDLIDLAVVAFTAYAIVRWRTSPTEYYSRLEILNVVGYAGIFFTCRYGLMRRSQALAVLLLLVLLGVFELGFGYYLSRNLSWLPFGPYERLHQVYAPRWIGTYGSPNHYGELLVMAMSAALAWGGFSKLSWPARIFFFWVALLILAGVICSGSRGSLLAACTAILALTVAGVRVGTVRWWVPSLGGVVLLCGIGVAVAHSQIEQDRLTEVKRILANGTVPAYIRVELDRDALRIARDYPIFGTGPATFVFMHPRYQDADFSHRAVLAHNDYLNTLSDYGAVGLGLALVFIFGVTRRLLRRPRAAGRWPDRVILATALMAWAAMLLHSLVDYNLHIPANAMLFLAVIGMGLRRAPSEADAPVRGWPVPRLAVAVAVGLLAFAYGAMVARTGLSALLYEHVEAQSLDARPSVSITGAKQALQIDPHNVPALVFLGDMYRMEAPRQTDLAARLADGQQSINAYQRAALENPLEDTITASQGLTFDLMYRYPEAYFCYVKALRNQPYDGQFWYRLGNHFWETGLLEKAEQAYLMGLRCPNGSEENAAPAQEIRAYLEAQGIPLPPVGTNPLDPNSVIVHPTVP